MNIEKCLTEAAGEIKKFLANEGGYENGYYTYVSGEVSADKKGCLKWSTPKATDELSDKGFQVRGEKLYADIQEIMKDTGVDKILIRSIDVEYGAHETTVVYVTETKQRVNLW